VIGGNERVVRPRLADAKFFFDQDRKRSLESRVEGLSKVVYHNQLGTQGERMQRVCRIAHAIGLQLGGSVLAEKASLAARLAKTDLLTDMVGEFPELQGTMGAYYARHDGLSTEIADAIEDHYKPRFASDGLPRGNVGIVVALADKLETLVGMFGIGNLPTGDKDPFALRRHALGVIRTLIERNLDLQIFPLVNTTYAVFEQCMLEKSEAFVRTEVGCFFIERLRSYFRDQGFSAIEVEAALMAGDFEVWADLPKRLAAVRHFVVLPESAALAAANKRIGNILKKSDAAQGQVNATLLHEAAEKELFAAMQSTVPQADALYAAKDYTASLQALAALRAPVDAFFDGVMVNADDPALKANRLALLQQLHSAMNRVADLSKLAA
jgi:glycyl-tRNA synthetase beta chain